MRDSMLIYRSFFEAIKGLQKEEQADVWNAIYELGLNGNEVELNGLSESFFLLIKPQILANLKRFENGKKPKVKQTISEKEAKLKQEESKIEANNNNNNNNNNNIPTLDEFVAYGLVQLPDVSKEALRLKYHSWVSNDWCVSVGGKTRKIKNWKSSLNNTLPYLQKEPKVFKSVDDLYAENVMRQMEENQRRNDTSRRT
jgi:molybdopterin converting factor small subunit